MSRSNVVTLLIDKLRFSDAEAHLRETKILSLKAMLQLIGGIGLFVSIRTLVYDDLAMATLLPSILGLVVFGFCILAFATGRYQLSNWLAVLTNWSAFMAELVMTGKINQFSFYGFFVIAFLAGMFMPIMQLIALTLLVWLLAMVYHFQLAAALLPTLEAVEGQTHDLIFHVLLLLLAAVIGRALGRRLDQAFDQSSTLSQRFKAIFHQSADAIFITDLDYRILEVNPEAAGLVQKASADLVGQCLLDFIPKGLKRQIDELVEDILVKGKLSNIRLSFITADDSELFLEISANLIFSDDGKPDHIQVILRDITERQQVEERFQQLALQDHLTKVDNRLSLTYHLNGLIARMNRDGGSFTVVYFDLDNFKSVNDRYGHYIGDKALVAFTKRLNGTIRSTDFLARMGGDEFVLIMEDYCSSQEVEAAVERVLRSLDHPFKIGEYLIHLETSYGISCYPEDGQDAEALLKLADTAMYSHKLF